MSLKVFQTTPRLVFLSDKKVFKFFNSVIECKEEVDIIKSSPLTNIFDDKTGFDMKFIELISVEKYHYTMKFVDGIQLNKVNDLNNYKLAGSWLRCLHSLTYDNKKAFLFGDYSSGHIYINNDKKEITTIDPGTGFGNIDFIEYDIARLIVDLLQSHNLNIFYLNRQIENFLNGYSYENLDYDRLVSIISFRINRNYEKRIKLGNGLKRYLSASYWYINSKLKFLYIENKLKGIIKNEK